MLDEGIFGDHALELLERNEVIVPAVDFAGALATRGMRYRDGDALGIVHEGM